MIFSTVVADLFALLIGSWDIGNGARKPLRQRSREIDHATNGGPTIVVANERRF